MSRCQDKIWNLLVKKGKLSQKDISKETEYSLQWVSYHINKMVEDNLLITEDYKPLGKTPYKLYGVKKND
jgi:predicted transcriptional regulator